jgi:hypothetical protein
MAAKSLQDIIEERARNGDGAYAIAYGLIHLAEAQGATADALYRLGNGNASTHYGAIEHLGMQVEKAARIIADSLGATPIDD